MEAAEEEKRTATRERIERDAEERGLFRERQREVIAREDREKEERRRRKEKKVRKGKKREERKKEERAKLMI
jgi:hypothetical protein